MEASRRRVTAKDVAREAGVSQSTVSYVLNDTPNQTIPESTRARVREAVERLGYTPSAAARALRTGASSTVLLVLPDAPIGSTVAQLIEGVTDGLEPHGYSVVFRRHRDQRAMERAWKEIHPAAVIDVAAFGEQRVAAIEAAGIPIVRVPPDGVGPADVLLPEIAVGRLQAAHLLERGHTRIGYAAPLDPRVTDFYGPRLAGVREVLAAARLAGPVVINIPADIAAAVAAITPWFGDAPEKRVTAVCAFNDETAFAVLAAMRVMHLRAPKDLAVIGVDNLLLSAYSDPPLTTVDVRIVDVVDAIVASMLAAVAGSPLPTQELTSVLVRRESV